IDIPQVYSDSPSSAGDPMSLIDETQYLALPGVPTYSNMELARPWTAASELQIRLSQCYEGADFMKEVKARLVWFGPNPSDEVVHQVMHQLSAENQDAQNY
ncbi:Hypothetical predicted protein, partial [Pelobates cultripes]